MTSLRKRASQLEGSGETYYAAHVNHSSIATEVVIQAGHKISEFIIYLFIVVAFICRVIKSPNCSKSPLSKSVAVL